MSSPVDTAASAASEAVAPSTGSPAARVAPWWERWGDRLNPLVVKEVRQGLRTRIFWACFGLMRRVAYARAGLRSGADHD